MEFIKEHWMALTSLILIILVGAIELFESKLPFFISSQITKLVLLIGVAVIQYYKEFLGGKQNNQIHQNIIITKESVKKVDNKIDELTVKFEKGSLKREEKYEESNTKLLTTLFNNSLISEKELENSIGNKKFISVLTFQKFDKPKELKLSRLYPKLFEKLGFVRLAGNWGYYIIAEENLYPEELRNLDKLTESLIINSKKYLNEEWDIILSKSKKEHKIFYNNHSKDINPLNFNILISKIDASQMKHGFLKKNSFNPEFATQLSSISDIRKLFLNETQKKKVKEFIFKSSLIILISDFIIPIKEKIESLESEFKKPTKEGGLGIKYFYDYWRVDKDKFKELLSKKINDTNLVEKYSRLIIKRSKRYENSLRKLGVLS